MIVNLSDEHSLVSNWVAELRDVNVQDDRLRFRRNLERIGEIAAYEISKTMPWKSVEIPTPLGTHESKLLEHQPVLATILRAGLPLHNGMLNYFDKADNAFISAYRQNMSCPVLDGRIIIISDPMLATGASIVKTIQYMKSEGSPREIHVVVA